MSSPLPASPSLEQLKNQAKDLRKALAANDPSSLDRLRKSHPRADELLSVPVPPRLSDAQLVIAREYGFPSWPKLKHYVDQARDRWNPFHRAFRTEPDYFDARAKGLLSHHKTGPAQAIAILRRRHPRFTNATDEEIRRAELTLEDARLVYAREHGFETWAELLRHLRRLASGAEVEPFRLAFLAIESGDQETLERLLTLDSGLVRAPGTNGNTLLNLAAGCRNMAAARMLVERGADVNQPNNKGWTLVHQAAYCGNVEVVRPVLEAGGDVTLHAYGDGGTPLVVALFWGHRDAAELLAERAIVPDNLRVAAGLGRLDLIRRCFRVDGSLTPEGKAHREFHRPHSGFPEWIPSDDPQEVLDEALVWASMNGRVEALEELVRRGADVNADPYRGTPLTRAACRGHLDVANWLLDHGADVNRRGTFGGPSHGQGITALHIAAQDGRMEMVRLLAERGADPTIEDDNYHSSPIAWANHFGHGEVAEYLKAFTTEYTESTENRRLGGG